MRGSFCKITALRLTRGGASGCMLIQSRRFPPSVVSEALSSPYHKLPSGVQHVPTGGFFEFCDEHLGKYLGWDSTANCFLALTLTEDFLKQARSSRPGNGKAWALWVSKWI